MIKEQLKDNIKFHFDARKGSLLDQSGNVVDMTVMGTPSWEMTDKGYSLRNEKEGAGGYLTNDTSDFQGSDSSGAFAFLFKRMDDDSIQYVVSSSDTAATNVFFVIFYFNATGTFTVSHTNADTQTNISGSTTIEANKWYHCLVGSNGTNYVMYVNGQAETLNSLGGDGDWLADTPNRDNLVIGALTRTATSDSLGSVRELLYFNTLPTPEQAAQLYSESLQEAHVDGLAKSNFQIPELYTGNESDCVGAWNMKLNEGVAVDNSSGGNDLTVTGGFVDSVQGVGGEAIRTDEGGYLRAAVSNYRSGDSSGSIEVWFMQTPSGAIKTLFMSSDEVTTSYYFTLFLSATEKLKFQKKNNDTIHAIEGATILPPNQWVYGRLTSNGSTYTLHINNTEDTPYVITTTNSGDWFDSVTARDNIVLGNFVRSASALPYNGRIDGMLISSTVQSDAEYERRYLKGAKKPTYLNDFSDVPVTLGTSTDDPTMLGGFTPTSGTHKISQDSNKVKWLESVTSGYLWNPSNQAFGTWQFDINKHTSGSILYNFISSERGSSTTTGQDGYTVSINFLGTLSILRSSAGTATTIMSSSAGYLSTKTDYSIRVTRSPADLFTMYIKGGAFTDWTLVDVSSGSGTNPVTNSVVRASSYQNIDIDAGDKISNIRFMLGDVTPTQVA